MIEATSFRRLAENCTKQKLSKTIATSIRTFRYGSQNMAENDRDDSPSLEDFRRQWQEEIALKNSLQVRHEHEVALTSSGVGQLSLEEVGSDNLQNQEKATSLYMKGVMYEQSGDMVMAIKCYKTAIKLVPDIEKIVYLQEVNKNSGVGGNKNSSKVTTRIANSEGTNQTGENIDDLLEQLQNTVQQDGRICHPNNDSTGTHLSSLPREVVIYLLKWVISSDLDFRSLETVARVCRGLFVCSREPELWKLACLRIWDTECGDPETHGFADWRSMSIFRPHLLFHGCYISKITYSRRGENSFQDVNYQPWHLVHYFRFLRFFTDRSALMLTTTESPSSVVGQLKCKNATHSGVLHGRYTLQGNRVSATFRVKRAPLQESTNIVRRRRKDNAQYGGNSVTEQVFYLELEIRSMKNRLHCALHWIRYSVQTFYQQDEPSLAEFDLNPVRYPPFWFSRVRSYNAESEHPVG